MDNLGKQARDKITGFEGVIIGKIVYLFGCSQYGISPKSIDGKLNETCWFDVGRIELIGDGISADSVAGDKPGGINVDAPRGVY